MIYTTGEISYPHYGQKSYRIEADLSNKNIPLQRHIWTDENGEVETEDWIDSIYESPESLVARGYKAVLTNS